MAATPNLPFPTNLFGNSSNDSKKEDKKSPIDELKDVKKYVDNIRSTIKYARLATSPVLLGPVIGIALVLIIMIFFDSGTAGGLTGGGGGGNNTTKPGTNPSTPIIPGFDIDIEGPPEKENDIILDYTVTITHDPSVAPPIENIEVYDTLPAGAELVETSGFVVDKNASPHVWPLSNTANQKIFTIRIRPNTTDANFYYTVSARVIGGGTGGGGSTETEKTFGMLVAGQGRNVTSLGDKSSFISTVIKNGAGRADFAARRTYLEQIYDAAVKYTVNPVLLLSMWGTENGFGTDPSNVFFGCGVYAKPPPSGFAEGVDCAADTVDYWMRDFESKFTGNPVNIPSKNGNTCDYTDAFVYAYEWYAPLCHASDRNEPARVNFSEFYKMFMGI